MQSQQFTEEEVEARAKELRAKSPGMGLVDAMLEAERQLMRETAPDETVFNLRIELKPRVAKFFRDQLKGHPSLTVEERLAVIVAQQLNKMRGEFLPILREAGLTHKIPENNDTRSDQGPLALPRSVFANIKGGV